MEQRQSITRIAGVDIGKRHLDAAVHGLEDVVRVENTEAGVSELIAWLKVREVGRVGLEASGGYERRLHSALAQAGLEVVVHQPIEVRRFAQLKRWRAKNDRQDARLIAAATAQVDAVKAAQDPRLADLAERLTAYEQVTDQIATLKTFLESVRLKDILKLLRVQIRNLESLKAKLAADILRRIKAEPDLLARFRLLLTLPGFGPIVAATAVVRMPELGSMQRGQAASLLGVAPFDRDSGQWKGQRFISGGRARPRRMLYLAALAASRCSPTFKGFAQRLLERGKPKKLVLVAIMRKLIEAANLVLGRGQPWLPQPNG
ncbi:MAG TPA: IS110 family transposase [Phenylobacterium sp.]